MRLRERALGRNAKHVKAVNSTGEGLSRTPSPAPSPPRSGKTGSQGHSLTASGGGRAGGGLRSPGKPRPWPGKGSLAEAGRGGRGHQHLLKPASTEATRAPRPGRSAARPTMPRATLRRRAGAGCTQSLSTATHSFSVYQEQRRQVVSVGGSLCLLPGAHLAGAPGPLF